MTRKTVGVAAGAMAIAFAIGVSAATLTITNARWDGSRNRLTASGTAARGTITLSNAVTGGVLGTVRVSRDSTWRFASSRLPSVPCRIKATQGAATIERIVDGAPSNCEGAVTLVSLAINGPPTVPEGGTATYAATATFSDASTQNVTTAASWTDNSPYASVSAGVLTATSVAGNQAVTLTASYTASGVTRSTSTTLTITETSPQPPLTGSHVGRFTTYEGTKTCLTCHASQAAAFHQSVHYQWQGDASESTGLNTPRAGKMGGINDFCIYPDINWLGKLTTVDNRQVDGGCGRCHTGRGAKPTPDTTTEQLENIDCLLCHSPNYKRTLAMGANNQYGFVPDVAAMTVSIEQAAVDIRLPTNDTCLNCHTKAGGGNNFKRGDIEEAHRTATPALDVHMASTASGGAGLSCTRCHTTVGHRIAGRGVDMRERDAVNTPVECSNCHSTHPHDSTRLNNHTARVACNTCHVPVFAKTAPTDMRRDWSAPGDLNPATQLYEPHMTLQTQVTPVYRFFNGRSRFYQFGTAAVAEPNGRILMAGPLGSVTEPGSKITAMKRHEGRQPIDPVTKYLLPLKIGLFFQSGVIGPAVQGGITAMATSGWTDHGYTFAETERYLGVYHEVAPKEQALSCSSCHGGTRLDFAALGYTPKSTNNGKPLCASCHGARTASFTTIHDKHVTERRYDCSTCHGFSKATP